MRLANQIKLIALISSFTMAGCSNHAYVALSASEQFRDVSLPDGNMQMIPNTSSVSTVGLAYLADKDHLLERVLPGTQLREIDRKDGKIIRTFAAKQVTAGCANTGPSGDEIPAGTICGLAMRQSDRHLFLDHPNGTIITEIDYLGEFVKHIRLQQPRGAIGGLGVDQAADTLYVLFINGMVSEIDMRGNEIRSFNVVGTQPRGLSVNEGRKEIYIPLVNGGHIGVFNWNGELVAKHVLQHAGTTTGVADSSR